MLTQKQELAVQYHLNGANKTEAVQRAFDCKNYNTAKSLASKLFKQEKVHQRLTEKQQLLDYKTIDDCVSFQNQLKHRIPFSAVINKLEYLMGTDENPQEDKRVLVEAIKLYGQFCGLNKEGEIKSIKQFKELKKSAG